MPKKTKKNMDPTRGRLGPGKHCIVELHETLPVREAKKYQHGSAPGPQIVKEVDNEK